MLSRARLQDLGNAYYHSVLCVPSTSRCAPAPHSSIDSPRRRVDPTKSMASLDDTPATDEQQVGRNGSLGILTYPADCGLYINMKTPSVNITTHLVTQHLLEEVHP